MQLLGLLIAFALVVALVPILRALAPRLELVDEPTARKRHLGAVPLVGGIAIFFAFVTAALMVGAATRLPVPFYLGVALVLIIGIADDRLPLRSSRRFAYQALIILYAILASGNILIDLGELVGPWTFTLGALAVPFTVFGMLGVVNAMNLTDGADGLASGIALTSLVSLALFFPEGSAARPVLFALIGAVAGFLVFNLRTPWRARASIFLGDAGSLMLGFVIAWFAVMACLPAGGAEAGRPLSPVSALWILIVPLFDTIGCIVRRKLAGRPAMKSDRQHLHHLLQRSGLTVGQTTATLILVNAAGGVIGLAAWRHQFPEYGMFALFVALFLAYLAVSLRAWRVLESTSVGGTGVSRVHMEPAIATREGYGGQS